MSNRDVFTDHAMLILYPTAAPLVLPVLKRNKAQSHRLVFFTLNDVNTDVLFDTFR